MDGSTASPSNLASNTRRRHRSKPNLRYAIPWEEIAERPLFRGQFPDGGIVVKLAGEFVRKDQKCRCAIQSCGQKFNWGYLCQVATPGDDTLVAEVPIGNQCGDQYVPNGGFDRLTSDLDHSYRERDAAAQCPALRTSAEAALLAMTDWSRQLTPIDAWVAKLWSKGSIGRGTLERVLQEEGRIYEDVERRLPDGRIERIRESKTRIKGITSLKQDRLSDRVRRIETTLRRVIDLLTDPVDPIGASTEAWGLVRDSLDEMREIRKRREAFFKVRERANMRPLAADCGWTYLPVPHAALAFGPNDLLSISVSLDDISLQPITNLAGALARPPRR